MTNTISIDCPWCKSRNQTMQLLDIQDPRYAPNGMKTSNAWSWYVSLKCRGCSGFSSATITMGHPANISVGSSPVIDYTSSLDTVVAQNPKLNSSISKHIPLVVKEALRDAFESRRPRAKCTHFRSAIEFALREAGLATKAGQPLGAILKAAQKQYGLPEGLVGLCDQVKAFGNWGLHWSETGIDTEDAEAAQRITEAILQYLFEMPALVAQAEARTKKAQEAHKNAVSTT